MIPARLQSRADELSVQQLRSFLLVYERQSFSEAARELELSAPTVWEQVKTVERRYAAQFFERRGRRIVITPAAELLYNSLRPLLLGLDSTFELVREQAGHGPKVLNLAVGMRMALEELTSPLAQFRKSFSDVRLKLIHGDTRTSEGLVATGEADLALTLEPPPGSGDATVRRQRVYEIDYLVLFPKRHPLAKRSALDLHELVLHPLVVGHTGTSNRRRLEEALQREGLLDKLRTVVETDNSAFTAACVRAGMGVGVLAGQPDGALTKGLAVRPLREALGRAWVVVVWKEGRLLPSAALALIDLVSRIQHSQP